MAKPYLIEILDFRTALAVSELDLTIGPTHADTDDALHFMMKVCEAFRAAQTIQNNLAGEGEDVDAILRTQDRDTEEVVDPISGKTVEAVNRIYQITGRVVQTETSVIAPFI